MRHEKKERLGNSAAWERGFELAEVKTDKDLAELYRRARQTINHIEGKPGDNMLKFESINPPSVAIENFKRRVTDDYAFRIIALYPFFSHMKAAVVEKFVDRIREWLGDYKKLASYSDEEVEHAVQEMMDDPKMFHSEKRIRAAIENARTFENIINEKGSFADYILSFNPYDNKKNLWALIDEFQKKFRRYGPLTSMHVLMDLGFPLIKPDLHIMRTFYRIGLVNKDNDIMGTYAAACSIAEAADIPISWIDDFVKLGLEDFFYSKSGVCGLEPSCNREKNPCLIRELCDWWVQHNQG